MKRMIAAIAVIAVVSSALAFNTKKLGQYCIANVSGGTCHVQNGVTEANNSTTPLSRFAYANWDGTAGGCTIKTCTVPITLYNE